MKQRFDIWWNGTNGVVEAFWALLMMWRHLVPEFGRLGKAGVEFVKSYVACMWILIAPFMFWLAPLIAIFTAYRIESEQETRARMRASIHKDGPA